MTTKRSVLRVREKEHIHPELRGGVIIEVLRQGEVVATIYGSREGIHIVSDLALKSRPFVIETPNGAPSWVFSLLGKNEVCPWCQGRKVVEFSDAEIRCPVCEVVVAT